MNNQSDLFHIYTINNPDDQPFEIYYNGELFKTIQPGMAVQVVKMIGEKAVEHLITRMVRKSSGPAAKNDPVLRAAWREKVLVGSTANPTPLQPTMLDQARMLQEQISQNPIVTPDLPVTPTPMPVPTPPVPASVPAGTIPTTQVPGMAQGMTDQQYLAAGYKFNPVTGQPLSVKPTGITPDQVDTSNIRLQVDSGPSAPDGLTGVTGPHHSDPETDAMLKKMNNGADGGRVLEVKDTDDTPYVPPVKEKPTREQLLAFMQNDLKIDINEEKTKAEIETKTDDELIEMTHYYEVAE